MIRAIIAFLASVLTAAQAFFIYTDGKTICFNNGCEIVDSLTTVSPLYFNVAGFLLFQTLFWCFLWGRYGSEYWHKFARLLLLAALGAEAVMVFFQYKIASVFCSYCLVVLALILLLNILSGLRQVFRGAVVFAAVMTACFSLQFSANAGSGASLDGGSMAMVSGEKQEVKLYLFFSATCGHCEKVIESLKEENNCSLRFNPVERIDGFSFPSVEYFPSYDPAINLNFMKSLSLKEIPVLVTLELQNIQVIKGGQQIEEYLAENCRTKEQLDYSGTSSAIPSSTGFLPPLKVPGEDGCEVAADCVDENGSEPITKKPKAD